MINDVDLSTSAPPGTVYQGSSKWTIPFYTASVCAILSILFALWYWSDTSKLNKQVADLQRLSATKDQEISVNNALPAVNGVPKTTVEARASELVTTVATFRKLLDGRKVWSKVVPILSSHTLQGITLTGMSIDDKLTLKIDGISRAGVIGSDFITSYGLIARQVVAYQKATDTVPSSDAKSTADVTVPAFSGVTLGSITQSTTNNADENKVGTLVGHFSISATLNPELIKTVSTASKEKATP